MIDEEDDYAPIRALNDLLYCERRCVLHRVEGVWVENRYTLEGTAGHARAHAPAPGSVENGEPATNLWLRSDKLRLVGRADVVEFLPQPFPIEYKRGRRRRWDNDDIQLCAQALCLEEMLRMEVPHGAIFHLRSKRRRTVEFSRSLRATTTAAIERLHQLLAENKTPPPVLMPRCKGCSVRSLCMPEVFVHGDRLERHLHSLYTPRRDAEVP